MRSHVALVTLLSLGVCAGAQAADEPFSYNNIEVAYVSTEIGPVDGDGYSIGGSFEINPNAFGFGSVNDIDYDAGSGLSSSFLTLGFGYHWPLNQQLDLVSGVSYERLQIKESGFGSDSYGGFGLNVGLRGRVAENLEVTAGAKYVDLGHGADDITWSAGGRYYFTPNFAAGIDISDNDDGSAWIIALRYDFGNIH